MGVAAVPAQLSPDGREEKESRRCGGPGLKKGGAWGVKLWGLSSSGRDSNWELERKLKGRRVLMAARGEGGAWGMLPGKARGLAVVLWSAEGEGLQRGACVRGGGGSLEGERGCA